ncbi:MAG: hypothetical protein H7343_10235 [Undibacterium sp.]|nr:hypothetical protein [Opitutaceae bacterium]
MRRKVVLTSINGVGIGQTATLDLPVGGRRYFGLFLIYKTNAAQATIEADITEVRLIINGKPQRRFSAADLNVVNATNGLAFTVGYLPIILAEPRRRTIAGEEGLAWGTVGVSTFRVEIDIAVGAVAPTLTAFAEVDDIPSPLGPIAKWYKETFIATGAQTLNLNTLPKRDAYNRIHARSALVTRMKATVDGLEVYDLDRTTAGVVMSRRLSLAQQVNNFSMVFDDSDQVTDGIPMTKSTPEGIVPVGEFRLDVTVSAAGTIPLLIERVGQPD